MRNSKWDKKTEKAILKLLDGAARKYGLKDARHAIHKWANTQTARLAIAKERTRLEQELARVNARLGR